jgi:CHAT domain-containing protein
VRFLLSPDGDGVVPWRSRLKPERTWYADCEHGDLADETDAFGAYFELLDSGRTRALPQTPPVRPSATRTAAGAAGPAAEPLLAVPALPSLPADLGGYVMGMRRSLAHAPVALPIAVRMVHGGLDYARFPLIVGHYQNDGIFGGTQRVDQKLGGQLGRMVDLKLFTGADRTSVYLRPPADDGLPPAYPGAIVVGLGAVGDLSPAALSATVTRAVLRFAFDHLHRDPWVVPQGPVPLRLSTLLIGTHVQAVTPRDSLAAVLGGIWRANQHLLRGGAGRPMQVAEVEVIELHEQTALDAAYELRRLLNRTEWRERLVWPDGTLEARTGRISGYRPSHGDTVWQRLVVRQQALGGMRFELIAERARVEATQVQADVASLAGFIQQLSDSGVQASAGDDNLALGQVLYQLLLPLSLKSRLLNLDDTVLVLDEATAAYPWELMVPPEDDSSLGDGPTPLALQAGMVRQRVASDFRALPTITAGHEALVVGAPATGGWVDENGRALNFSPLPGARAEADQVGRWLADDHRPWRITALLGEAAPFQRVRMALLARPYRLLHLSGHGVVDFWVGRTGDPAQPPAQAQALRKTGMLLNNQQVLTAADIEQMGTVPEFVFINCCYSGREGDETRLPAAQRALPLLASSLALQFIKMGSRAVVAAGWQVDDQAGLAFAQALYAGLLADNRPFGEAVRLARVAVHQAHPGGNTWGAYQCYGDPDWRLADTRSQRGYAEQYGSSRLRGADSAMSREELADRVLQMVALAGDKPRAALLMQLDDLAQTLEADPVRQAWLDHSRLRSAFGQAYRELGDHAAAVRWLQRGVRNAYSRVTLRDVELMVNSLSRLATPRSLDIAEQILDRLEATDDNDLLYDPADHAPGDSSARSERECLRGSNRMHRALQIGTFPAGLAQPSLPATQRRQRAQQYKLACDHFTTGYAGKLKPRDKADRRAYALSNAVLCGALALLYRASRPSVLAQVERLRQQLDDQQGWEAHAGALIEEIETQGLSTSFWHYTNTLELITARALLRVAICVSLPDDRTTLTPEEQQWLHEDNNKLDAVRADLAQARQLMRQALVRWPSPVEGESIRSRFEAVREACLLAAGPAHADYRPQLQALATHAAEAVALLQVDGTGPR